MVVDVGLINLHFLQGIQEQHISGGAIIDEESLDSTIGNQQRDDKSVMVRIDEP